MPDTEASFSIAPLERIEDFLACERLQQAVWQLEAEQMPKATATMLIASQRYGGMVLGAFDPEGHLIGFLFALPGTVPPDNPAAAGPHWQLCSRIMGVHPDWQGRGVGHRLKLAQREWALAHGYELVTWTYDPLEAANGTLNLGKLGAVCRCYLRDFYGPMADGLNVGLPSDRFEVAWWVGSKRVRRRVEEGWHPPRLEDLVASGAMVVNPARIRPDGWPEPGPVRPPEGEAVLVEIPARIQAVKRADPGLALAWRLNVREACEAAFAAGYTACDVVKATVEGISRVYYLLHRQSEHEGMP
ncbi:MAG: GNAT family N-acetyltransferase [Anaerolineae bacterium]|nr:GNAT family N-acetyltransferase [Anaerolineae bacterium]